MSLQWQLAVADALLNPYSLGPQIPGDNQTADQSPNL